MIILVNYVKEGINWKTVKYYSYLTHGGKYRLTVYNTGFKL